MTQGVLWHDSIYDALGADIAAAGGIKKVAKKLYPTLDEETAATKLRNAINPEQPHKICPDEVLHIKRLAAAKGSYATVTYEARELSLAFTRVNPEDEAAQLRREIRDGLSGLNQRMDRLERLESREGRG